MLTEDLISGIFLTDEIIPKSKMYLLKYFKNGAQRAFIRYCFISMDLKDWKRFIDHTGHHITKRWHEKMVKKIERIVKLHEKCKKDFDLESVFRLETGDYKPHGGKEPIHIKHGDTRISNSNI